MWAKPRRHRKPRQARKRDWHRPLRGTSGDRERGRTERDRKRIDVSEENRGVCCARETREGSYG
jgi:hypothetical protein